MFALTYIYFLQVKTYAVHCQPESSKHNSQFFVQAKNEHVDNYEGSDKYNSIARILNISAFNPPLLLLAAGILAYIYIYGEAFSFTEWLSYGYVKEDHTNLGWVYDIYRRLKEAIIPALIFFNVGLNLMLLAMYVFSLLEIFEYGKELFCSNKCIDNAEKRDYCSSHQSIPLKIAISSAL